MVTALGCCASAACCAGSAACQGLCGCFQSCGLAPKSNGRLAYVVLQLAMVIVAITMMFTLKPAADNIDFIQCNEASG